jgi:hypothetical protein
MQHETYTFPVGMRIYDEDGVLQDPLTSGGGGGGGAVVGTAVSRTVQASESGTTFVATADGVVFTLPDTADGLTYSFVNSYDANIAAQVNDSSDGSVVSIIPGDVTSIVGFSGSWYVRAKTTPTYVGLNGNQNVSVSAGEARMVMSPWGLISISDAFGITIQRIARPFSLIGMKTADPHVAGEVWVDTSTGNVKQSQG